ncbi:MAG: hypothetical protein PHW82_02740 [Bacteroidales bacterium]|nr:hypothetical protein [Bacteroidales bacterium]
MFQNTDNEKYTILKNCSEMILSDDELSPVFDEEIRLKIDKYFDVFDKIKVYDNYLYEERQKEKKEFLNLFEKASLFVRHYYISMSMAIERGELPVNTADFYGLKYPFKIPVFKSDVHLIKTAQKLFDDDLQRTSVGGKYFTNPSIGAVKVWVEKFVEAVEHKNNKYNIKRGEVENIDKIRKETDELLQDIFDALITKIGAEPDETDLKFISDCGFEISVTEDNQHQVMKNNNNGEDNKSSNTKPDQLKFDL